MKAEYNYNNNSNVDDNNDEIKLARKMIKTSIT